MVGSALTGREEQLCGSTGVDLTHCPLAESAMTDTPAADAATKPGLAVAPLAFAGGLSSVFEPSSFAFADEAFLDAALASRAGPQIFSE